MGLFRRKAPDVVEKRDDSRSGLTNPANWLLNLFGTTSYAKKKVNASNALEVAAVYACVRVLAESVASLPLHLYQRDGDRRTIAKENPLHGLLHDAPNTAQTSFEWREMMQGHLCLRGQAFSMVERDGGGTITEIIPLHPDKMKVVRNPANPLVAQYVYDGNGLPSQSVLHLRGIGGDIFEPYTPIALMRNAVGLAMATEEHGSGLFANGAAPDGILSTDQTLTKEQEIQIASAWDSVHKGTANAHKVGVLSGGLKWQNMGLNNTDAQFLETRKFQATDIARFFRVPPHMIADLERATFSNIEHQSIEFVVHTVRPWLVRIEQRLNQTLLTDRERAAGLYFEFKVDGLLRGDQKSRYEAYSVGITGGFLTRNEVRRMENMDPLDGLDDPLTPLNLAPIGAQPTPADETQ